MSDFVLDLCYELAISASFVLSVPFAINKLRAINGSVESDSHRPLQLSRFPRIT